MKIQNYEVFLTSCGSTIDSGVFGLFTDPISHIKLQTVVRLNSSIAEALTQSERTLPDTASIDPAIAATAPKPPIHTITSILQCWTIMNILYRVSLFGIIYFLNGCSTYNPIDHYDPNAVEKLGRVTSKSLSRHETRPAADNLIVAPVPGISLGVTLIMQQALNKESQIPIYAYKVMTEDKTEITILSEFPSFKPSDCVKVFISTRPDYPRMRYWEGCQP